MPVTPGLGKEASRAEMTSSPRSRNCQSHAKFKTNPVLALPGHLQAPCWARGHTNRNRPLAQAQAHRGRQPGLCVPMWTLSNPRLWGKGHTLRV